MDGTQLSTVEVEGEVVRRVVGQPTVPLTDSTFHRRRAKGQVGRENFVSHEWRQTRSSSRMVTGYAQLGVMQDKELAKGSRLCNCNQRQLQGNWKTV